jgi:uncharacterized NAD-dependent epimerase/dehydratase family protein
MVFLGDATDYKQAKVAMGLLEWRPEHIVGYSASIKDPVSYPGVERITVKESVRRGAKTFLIGIAPFSTTLPDSYHAAVEEAIKAGLNIANPLHSPLPASLVVLAKKHKVQIYNFRHRDQQYPKATGEKREGLRLLTVGTDCACGKKFTALSITNALQGRDVDVSFRSTGQTGFLISDSGINNDTIQADFLSGAAEWLTPANSPSHWDIVEGQGALSHPSFGAGSLSLIYGTQPDLIVMCHEPGRVTHRGINMVLPDIIEEINLVLAVARRTSPTASLGAISLFTRDSSLSDIAETVNRIRKYFPFVPIFDPTRKGPEWDSFISYLAKVAEINGQQF